MGSRAEDVKHYKKYKSKWKKEIKDLKKHKNMIFSITNKSGSRWELNKIKNIRMKSANKNHDDISNY